MPGLSFGGDENVLILTVFAYVCEFTKNHWIIHFQWVNYIVCEWYYSKTVKSEKRNKKNGHHYRSSKHLKDSIGKLWLPLCQ